MIRNEIRFEHEIARTRNEKMICRSFVNSRFFSLPKKERGPDRDDILKYNYVHLTLMDDILTMMTRGYSELNIVHEA